MTRSRLGQTKHCNLRALSSRGPNNSDSQIYRRTINGKGDLLKPDRHRQFTGKCPSVERGSILISAARRTLVARLSLRRDITTVERCAPIVHINQKYPIYNYCRSRLIYIYTPWDNRRSSVRRASLCSATYKKRRRNRGGIESTT